MVREEVAKLLQKKLSWLKWAERKRLIPHVRVGRAIRYRESDLRAWIEGRQVHPVTAPSAGDSDED